jgi:hypothetical protein
MSKFWVNSDNSLRETSFDVVDGDWREITESEFRVIALLNDQANKAYRDELVRASESRVNAVRENVANKRATLFAKMGLSEEEASELVSLL